MVLDVRQEDDPISMSKFAPGLFSRALTKLLLVTKELGDIETATAKFPIPFLTRVASACEKKVFPLVLLYQQDVG